MLKAFLRKTLCIVLCIAVLGIMPVSAAASDITVNRDYVICIGNDSSLAEAANYLNRYINEICGFTLKVSKSTTAPDGCISLSVNPSIDSGYTISSDSKNVYISGSTLRNTVDGICAFLNKYGGITYYTSTLTVKERNQITVPCNTDYAYTPYFEMTDTDWYSPKDLDYSLFNGISGTEYRDIPAGLGGGAEYISGFAHTYTNQFCSKDKYFESDPNCFALSALVRNKESLCLSNPKTLEIVTQEVLDLLEEKHNPKADLQIVSLTQNDNVYFCTCPRCAAKYIKYGSISGLNLEFVNSVARTVKEHGYDNVAIDTFAYMYTRSAPKNIVPEDNVIIRLCSIECCFSHDFEDKSCVWNMGFANDLKDWAKICDRLYVWDYVTNFANYIGIFPNFGTLQKNMQFFYENNVKGIYEEGNYQMSPVDTEFGELRAYLISKLMQDPYCDLEAEREAFLNAYYGDGGKYIGEFIDIITDKAESRHLSIYSSMNTTCFLTKKDITKCDELWKKAEAETAGKELENVKNSELAWRYWKQGNNASEYSKLSTRKDTKAQFESDLAATEISRYRECDDAKAFWLGILQAARFVLADVILPFAWIIDVIKN